MKSMYSANTSYVHFIFKVINKIVRWLPSDNACAERCGFDPHIGHAIFFYLKNLVHSASYQGVQRFESSKLSMKV